MRRGLQVVIYNLLIFMMLSGCSWSKRDRLVFTAGMLLKTVDCAQTLDIADNPDEFYEINPIVGKHPSRKRVLTYFAFSGLLYYFIADWLPEGWRTAWLSFGVGVSGTLVYSNYKEGIRSGL